MLDFKMYLIIINIIGLIAYFINMKLHEYHKNIKKFDSIIMLLAFMGSAISMLIFSILFGRKALKHNMMIKVFVICMSIIHLVLILIYKNYSIISFKWIDFKIVLVYLVIMNILAFILFGIDKQSAIHHLDRIQIVTLLLVAFLGGSIGSLAGMYVFRHKTQKNYFYLGIPLIIVMQVFVLVYLYT